MRKRLGAILAAGTLLAALCQASPPAMAAGTWTVTGGPNFTGTASSGTTFTITDTTSGASFTCTVVTVTGTVIDQSGGANAIGHVTSITFKCQGPLGSTATGTLKVGTTATINASTFSGGVTTLTFTGVDIVMTINSLIGTCTAEIKGTAGAKYTNSSHLLQFTTAGDSLSVTSASGACTGIIKVHDVITISSGTGGITLTGSPTSSIQISQP